MRMPLAYLSACIRGLIVLWLALLIGGCITTVPITGRSQLNSQPDELMHRLGSALYSKKLSGSKVVSSGSQNAMVQRIFQKVLAATEDYYRELGKLAEFHTFQWSVVLIEDSIPNARCYPNGNIMVFTGILPFTKNEDGLAALLGHEISHALARHSAERVTEQDLAGGLSALASSSFGPKIPNQTGNLSGELLDNALRYGFILPHSRLHEAEADHMGLILMAMAGFDPKEAPLLWQRMSVHPTRPEILASHPAPLTRMNQLNALVPTVEPIYKKAKLLGR